MTRYLLEHGATVDVKAAKNKSPLHIAIKVFKEQEICHNVVALLLERGANVNDCDSDGASALHLALQKKDVELFKFLIAEGASINLKNNQLRSPLFIAISNNLPPAVSELLKLGASVNEFDSEKEGVYLQRPWASKIKK